MERRPAACAGTDCGRTAQRTGPTADPKVAFKDAQVALLVGARPRGPGMERKDLLEANGKIFEPQGRALSEVASRDIKVLVVGNPANTNCLIAMKNAPKLKPSNFTAMMRLDHNRALSQVAQKIGKPVDQGFSIGVWSSADGTVTSIEDEVVAIAHNANQCAELVIDSGPAAIKLPGLRCVFLVDIQLINREWGDKIEPRNILSLICFGLAR